MNYDYPETSYERRREIIQAHEDYQKGLLYFVANDPRIPTKTQERFREWGLAKDEFTDNGNWPHQIYVREARRMIGKFVMTENELLQKKPTPEPIGMGSYTIDSHNIQRYVTSHIAFGSIRMEPVFMILGESAATAAVLALDAGLPVQQLPYEQSKARLEQDNQILAASQKLVSRQ